MYVLTIKDGFITRFFGPYVSTAKASEDLQWALSKCSADKTSWQIHSLEPPAENNSAIRGPLLNEDTSFPKAS